MNNILSYAQFLKDRADFRKSGSKHSHEFNFYDTPSHKFFKILFYFGDSSAISNEYGKDNGLLHPTWEIFKQNDANKLLSDILHYYDYNSAWSYLKLNDENERAEKLERFVSLLSNINSCSPWYFKSISGLDAALERKGPNGENFEVGERQKITINCLPDAFDNRIGTLLDLYRDITWSWINKKQIIPSNLLRFDMAVYIFESPLSYWHKDEDDLNASNTNNYTASYKLLEFHDCEFEYNSVKSGYSDISNESGITPTYSIDISFGDCYELSYNELLLRTIGDVIATDTYQAIIEDETNVSKVSYISEPQKDDASVLTKLEAKIKSMPYIAEDELNFDEKGEIYSYGNLEMRDNATYAANYKNGKRALHNNVVKESEVSKNGFLGNTLEQLYNAGRQQLDNYLYDKTGFSTNLKRAMLGNLYTYSLTQIGSQLSDLSKGNLVKAGQSVKQYIENAQERAAAKIKKVPTGNIFNKSTIVNN